MQWPIKSKNKIIVVYTFLSLLSFSFLISCGDNRESAETVPQTVKPESFTFFELGTNTKLTEHIRKDLGKKLGRDAIERRSILDLNTNYAGFIKKYLPKINELNRKINFPPEKELSITPLSSCIAMHKEKMRLLIMWSLFSRNSPKLRCCLKSISK